MGNLLNRAAPQVWELGPGPRSTYWMEMGKELVCCEGDEMRGVDVRSRVLGRLLWF
jgi:hypothetical protein